MADDTRTKLIGFGDAELARDVIEINAESFFGIDTEDCDDLDIPKKQCETLHDALADSPYTTIDDEVITSIITLEERKTLSGTGFSDEFIQELAGPDGKRAMRQCVNVLAERIVPLRRRSRILLRFLTHLFRFDPSFFFEDRRFATGSKLSPLECRLRRGSGCGDGGRG